MTGRRIWNSAGIFFSTIVFLAATPAQEAEGPAQAEGIKEALEKLRSGAWRIETIKTVVEGFLKEGKISAAGWWLTLAEQKAKESRLPPAAWCPGGTPPRSGQGGHAGQRDLGTRWADRQPPRPGDQAPEL